MDAFLTSATLEEYVQLIEALGYGERLVSIDAYGIRRFNSILNFDDLRYKPPTEILIKFLGGPPTKEKSRSYRKSSVKCYAIDCILRTTITHGIPCTIEIVERIFPNISLPSFEKYAILKTEVTSGAT